jgi:protein-ribulosamine 3-kinase
VSLPADLQRQIELEIGEQINQSHAVGGGCISNTARVDFNSGARAFLKWSRSGEHPETMLREEAASLEAIAATRTVRVPAVLSAGIGAAYQWLLLEWLEPGPRTRKNQRALGEQLAELHKASSKTFGWPHDNFIGSLPQSNRQHKDWSEFWGAERLQPQLKMAKSHLGDGGLGGFDALIAELPQLLDAVADERPSLLHGDLWSGNMHMLADGSAALIDPSTYYGHREVDIAMSKLFGGFSDDFYDAYSASWPHRDGLERRIIIYQLYYLLVHVNLFGGSYVQQTMNAVRQLGY